MSINFIKYKSCPKCGTKTRYKNIIELYEIKDMYSLWTCSKCGVREKISNDELIIRCRSKSKSSSLKA